jgi:hypothetical protein
MRSLFWPNVRRILLTGTLLCSLAGGALLLYELRQMCQAIQAQQLDVLMLRVTLLGFQTHVTSMAGALSRQVAQSQTAQPCARLQPICTAGLEED